ncbi:hypothetical protein D3C81_1942100 [compost metagenome]
MRQKAGFTYVMRPFRSSARRPISIEFSIARRNEVSASRARCASERRLVCRHMLHRLQSRKQDRPTTSHSSMLLGRFDGGG